VEVEEGKLPESEAKGAVKRKLEVNSQSLDDHKFLRICNGEGGSDDEEAKVFHRRGKSRSSENFHFSLIILIAPPPPDT
jgi:hypothetical protein